MNALLTWTTVFKIWFIYIAGFQTLEMNVTAQLWEAKPFKEGENSG